VQHNFGTNANWNRAFWAERFDAPPCASAIISAGAVAVVMPPVGTPEGMQALLDKLVDRVKRPHLGPRERR
jgi:hypothetical protein